MNQNSDIRVSTYGASRARLSPQVGWAAGSPCSSRLWGPLLLVDPSSGLTPEENAWIDAQRGSTSWGFVFGGTGALPPSVDGQLATDISTATGVTEQTVSGVTPLVAAPVNAVSGQAAVGNATRIAPQADIAKR